MQGGVGGIGSGQGDGFDVEAFGVQQACDGPAIAAVVAAAAEDADFDAVGFVGGVWCWRENVGEVLAQGGNCGQGGALHQNGGRNADFFDGAAVHFPHLRGGDEFVVVICHEKSALGAAEHEGVDHFAYGAL